MTSFDLHWSVLTKFPDFTFLLFSTWSYSVSINGSLLEFPLPESVKLEICRLLHSLCDLQLRNRVEQVVKFASTFVKSLQSVCCHCRLFVMCCSTIRACRVLRFSRFSFIRINILDTWQLSYPIFPRLWLPDERASFAVLPVHRWPVCFECLVRVVRLADWKKEQMLLLQSRLFPGIRCRKRRRWRARRLIDVPKKWRYVFFCHALDFAALNRLLAKLHCWSVWLSRLTVWFHP